MRHVIVGTAGHIDHGKTTLVEALTGIDCDRWAEEKERGITIDIGFAHLEEGDTQIGFVDVPGHQRFLHNALAGLGGIRMMLLVVAADEGVEPQTREHLEICSLLGIPAGLAVVTKADLVEPDLLELARLEVEELLAATPFAGSPVLTASSHTGEGLDAVRLQLLEMAREYATEVDVTQPARLPVDRAFHLQGRGVVVTGTLISGVVRPGDRLDLQPSALQTRVRSVQVHGRTREAAEAGERTALQLSGVELPALERGVELVTPGSAAASTSLAATFQLLPTAPAEIRGWVPIRFHLYAAEVLGRLRPLGGPLAPGASGPVEIRLRGRVTAARGDRFIVRRPSPATTLGGGEILDPRWMRRRGRSLDKALAAFSGDLSRTIVLWVEESAEATAHLEALTAEQSLLAVRTEPPRWITPTIYRRIFKRAQKVLDTYFKRQRLAEGMPKAEAVARILSPRGAPLADTYLSWLESQKVLVIEGNKVNLPGRTAQLTGEESALEQAILGHFRAAGLKPPAPAEVSRQLAAKPQIVDGVVHYLVERHRLTRLPGGLLIATEALDKLRADLLDTGWDRFTVPQFKERFGLTRKWAIPFLEHLDSVGATRRLGSERQVVRRS